jgi:peptide/nickel transport system substrate-binding protein
MRISGNSGHTPALGTRRRLAQRLLGGFVAAIVLGGTAACDLAGANSAPEVPKTGGTLYIYAQANFSLLDPQRTYSANEMNVLRLMNRTLTTYRSVPGPAASEIVGDLATDIGRPSENNTVWEFTLKPNLRWEDGSPVTCSQVKYGIERRFSALMDEGAPYPMSYLKDNAKPYEGPWLDNNNNGEGLESITCDDERNIRFELKQPVGDFGYTVALSTFAPVPPDEDEQTEYAKRPFSNGPYKIDKWTDQELVLVRNSWWNASTDQVRKAYPDRIVFRFQEDQSGIVTNQLIEDQGDARNAIQLDGNVAPNFLQQVVNDPDLLRRTVSDPTGAVRYMAINTNRVKDQICREVLIHAFNKRKYRAVNGGSVTGDYATTMIPPQVRAHRKFDIYDSIRNPEGNVTKALELLQDQEQANKPCDRTIRVAFPDTPIRRRLMTTVVEAYQRVDIIVELVPIDPSIYFNSGVGDPTNDYDMMLVGWIPDWANGSAILPPLFHSNVIPPVNPVTGHAAGNVNFSLLRDKQVDSQMDAALAETTPERQWALWGDIDEQIQRKAVTIPILYEKAIRLAGSNVRGGFIHPAFGMPDLCALGLAQP